MNILLSRSGTDSRIQGLLSQQPIDEENPSIIKYTSYGCIIFKTLNGVVLLESFIKVYSPITNIIQ